MKKIIKRSLCLGLAMALTATVPVYKPLNNTRLTVYGAQEQLNIIKAQGWLESAYVEWTPVSGITGYNVYFKGANNSYTKIDKELIRSYGSYYRADVPGLVPGTYSLKVVGVVNDQESATAVAQADNLKVEAFTREGFAFSSQSPMGYTTGGYNRDGSINPNAEILYITNQNKDGVTLGGDSSKGVGLNGIMLYREQKKIKTPLIVRFIGKVEMPAGVENYMLRLMNTDNITIEGIGDDATIHGWGFTTKRTNNLEFRNLGIMWYGGEGGDGDSLSLDTDNKNIWIHNIDFFYGAPGKDSDQVKGDGSIDLKSKSDYITVDYCHFWDSGKSCVAGGVWEAKNPDDPGAKIFVTYHHNWFDHSDSRHPRCVAGSVHVYNNYYDGCAKYGIGAAVQSSVFSEGNYYRNVPRPMIIATQGSDVYQSDGTYATKGTLSGQTGGMIKSCNDYIVGAKRFVDQNTTPDANQIDAYTVTDPSQQVPNTVTAVSGGHSYNNFDTADTMYSYKADTPQQAKDKVTARAGRIGGGDFKWSFDSTQDSNSNVIPELQAAVKSYTDKLVATNVEAAEAPTTQTTTEESTQSTTENTQSTTQGDKPSEPTTTSPVNSSSWTADKDVPSWLDLSGYTKGTNSSDHDVFASNDAEVAAISNKYSGAANTAFTLKLSGASKVTVYIAGNNNSDNKGTLKAALDGNSLSEVNYSLPGRKTEGATPCVINTTKGGSLVLTPGYAALLYKITVETSGTVEPQVYDVSLAIQNTTDYSTTLTIGDNSITLLPKESLTKVLSLAKGEYTVTSSNSMVVASPATFTVTGEGQTVAVSLEQCQQNVIVTDNKGGFIGGYATLKAAVDADTTVEGCVISLKPGYYHETLDINKNGITVQKMSGEEGEVVIHYDNGAYGGTMKGVLRVSGSNVALKDITVLNSINTDYGSVKATQKGGTTGAALIADGDNSLYQNCKFVSVQDTVNIYHYSSGKPLLKQTFEGCVFYGATDFICGSGQVDFNGCQFRYFTGALEEKADAYVFAPSQKAQWTVNGGQLLCDPVCTVTNFYYGRPWEDRSDNSQTLNIYGLSCNLTMGTKGLMGFGGPTGGGRSHSVNDFSFNVYEGNNSDSQLIATSNVTALDVLEMNASPVIKLENGKDMLLVADFGKSCGEKYIKNIMQDIIEVGFVSEANASADKITDTNAIRTTTLYKSIVTRKGGSASLETEPLTAEGNSYFATGILKEVGTSRKVKVVPYIKYDAKHNDATIDAQPIYQFGSPVEITIGY